MALRNYDFERTRQLREWLSIALQVSSNVFHEYIWVRATIQPASFQLETRERLGPWGLLPLAFTPGSAYLAEAWQQGCFPPGYDYIHGQYIYTGRNADRVGFPLKPPKSKPWEIAHYDVPMKHLLLDRHSDWQAGVGSGLPSLLPL